MKNSFKLLALLFLCLKSNGQTITKNNFLFEKTKIDYLITGSSNNHGKFYVVIKDTTTNFNEFNEDLKACLKKKKTLKSNCYYLVIPKEFTQNKEKLVLDFINNILDSKKLFESEMNIISDGNYFSLYEQTKFKNDNYRKNLLEKRRKIATNKKDNVKNIKTQDSLLVCKTIFNKYGFLNKINTLKILNHNEDFCDFLN